MFKKISLILSLCLLLGAWTCGNSNAQKALTASRDFGAAMNAAQQTVVVLHTKCTAPNVPTSCETISDTEDFALQSDFLAVAKCGPPVDAAFALGTKASITAAITTCSSALQTAINVDAAGIKNPAAKASVTALLVSAQTVLNTVLAFNL